MFDPKSDYALNKLDKDAIICPSATGIHTRLTREDFTSEEEFFRWKVWSDKNYQKIEVAGQKDDRCLSLDDQKDVPVPSAETFFLASYMAKERVERRRLLLNFFRTYLTAKQYRRMCLYYLEGKKQAEIAALEGANQSSISRSISSGAKIVEKFFEEFFRHTA